MQLRRGWLLILCQPWTTDALVRQCATLAEGFDTTGPIALASETLYKLSGSRWPGACGSRTYRPCAGGNQGCEAWLDRLSYDSLAPTGHCTARCALSTVRLPGPVMEVTEVRVDGSVVDPGLYRVKRGRLLQRTDGLNWPCSQDLTLADTEVGTFAVDYERGAAPPPGGVAAATELAAMLAADACGGDCGTLAYGLRSVSREGNHWEYADIGRLTRVGKTGLVAVDLWLSGVNPDARRRSAAVFGVEDLGTRVR